MMIDILKKSFKSKIWRLFSNNFLNIELSKLLAPRIFLSNIKNHNFNIENIYNYAKKNPDTKWNMPSGAYQSNHDLQGNKDFFELKKAIENHLNLEVKKKIFKKKTIGKFRVKSMWFVIMKENTDHHMHLHPKSALSGVMYLKLDKPNASSALKILVPNLNLDKYSLDIFGYSTSTFNDDFFKEKTELNSNNKNHFLDKKIYEFIPSENDMIIFNSYMYHWVDRYSGEEDRISLAWDAIYTI